MHARQRHRHPGHRQHGQQPHQRHTRRRQPPRLALCPAQRSEQRTRIRHPCDPPLRHRHTGQTHEMIVLRKRLAAPCGDRFRLGIPAREHLAQPRLGFDVAQHPLQLGMRKNDAVRGEHDQARIVARRQDQRVRQQALRLQAQHATDHAQHLALVVHQRQREHDPRLARRRADHARYLRFALNQGAQQDRPLIGVEARRRLQLAVLQIQNQPPVAARDFHRIKKAQRRKPLLQHPLEQQRRLQHLRRDAFGDGAQHLLALFDLAGQQTRHQLDLVGLLTQQPPGHLFPRRVRHHPGGQSPGQRHRDQRDQQHAPHQRTRHVQFGNENAPKLRLRRFAQEWLGTSHDEYTRRLASD